MNEITIIRRYIKDNIIVHEQEYCFTDMLKAVKLLDDLHKIDLVYFQKYIYTHSSSINECDNTYNYGIEYNFMIDNVSIECVIVGADSMCNKDIFLGKIKTNSLLSYLD